MVLTPFNLSRVILLETAGITISILRGGLWNENHSTNILTHLNSELI